MDPNLTLAHITHNTAVVLLHQGIAYPSPEWQSVPIRLPSASSAETCMAAAVEVSIIAEEFLRNSQSLTNPQFAFCLFICGRMFVAHSVYYNTPLTHEFDTLISSLWEMASRWNGVYSTVGDNLASKFAIRLNQARQLGPNTLDIRQTAYSENQSLSAADALNGNQNGISNGARTIDMSQHPFETSSEDQPAGIDQGTTPDSITLAFPPLPLAFQAQPVSNNQSTMHSPNLDQMTQALNGYANQNSDALDIAPVMSLDGNVAFEHLNCFLDYSVLPNQRVSKFSHPTN